MANPVTHLEKTIAGEVQPVTHLEHVIAEHGGGGGGGGFTPTTAQLAAMNSGITSEDVEQISTNENNISAVMMGTQSTGDIDLNAVTTNSYKMYTNTTSNLPTSDGSWYFVKTTVFNNNTMLQEATAMNAGAKTYTRIKRSGNWQAWKLSNLDSTQEAAVNSGINDTLVGQITTNQNNILSVVMSGTARTADLNSIAVNDFGVYTNSSSNLPSADYCFVRTSVNPESPTTSRLQEAFVMSTGVSYVRTMGSGEWHNWLQITNQ